MTDPVPDLKDSTGRARRIVLALGVGVLCAIAAYLVTTWLARAELDRPRFGYARGAGRFVYYMTSLAFVGGLGITLAIANARAKAAWRKRRDLPVAKVVS